MSARFDTRHHAYALCSDEEYEVVKSEAKKAGLTISDYVRRCINGALLEAGDDVPLLRERRDRAA